MRFNRRPFLCILFAYTLAVLVPAEITGGTLVGRVLRPPAATETAPEVNRYRGRESATTDDTSAEPCQCTPGLYSVVWLEGANLPQVTLPKTPPAMAQKQTRFEPSVLAVAVGTTVSFPNLDPFFHNVFSYSKTKKFDLGRYPQGSTAEVTFDKPGIVKVFCEIHYSMRAYVHVLESSRFTVSDERGSFQISDVPDGEYTLHVWQENLPPLTQVVNASGDSTHVEVE